MSKGSLAVLLQGFASNLPDISVSGLSLDSRQIQSGFMFVALQGTRQHGLEHAQAVIEAGASVIVHDHIAPQAVIDTLKSATIPVIGIPGLAQHLGDIAKRFYQTHQQAEARVIGVTGTDGKTSTTHFIAEALHAAQQQAAVIGTLGIGQPGKLHKGTHTTPDAIQVQQHLAQLAQAGFDTIAMEVSSHALDQGRVNAVNFEMAVLTNLTRDHLDYHGTVAAYADAKRKLFQWPSLKHAVLNLDDAFGQELAQQLQASQVQVWGYGVGERANYPTNGVIATEARFDNQGIWAKVVTMAGEGILQAPGLGKFNLHNLLAALSVLLAYGLDLPQALKALQQVYTVPGRMERVTASTIKDVLVAVDYAHTPGALSQVLSAARVHTRGKLICVFGCGGDRDAGKRPLMAGIAEQQADQVIVTDDNPRTESAQQIFQDIRAGFKNAQAVTFEHDRAKAIHMAVKAAQAGDTILIAGKGHETVQLIAGEQIPFDDREQAALALEECAA